MSSISGRVALPLYGPYAASKFALEALSDALRRELRGSGVARRCVIEPGAIAHADLGARRSRAADALWEAMPPVAHERYGPLVDAPRRWRRAARPTGEPAETVAAAVVARARPPSARGRAT